MAAAQGSVSVEAREEREREGAEQGVSSLRAESESEVGPGEGSGEERGQLSRGRPWVFPRHHESPVLDP